MGETIFWKGRLMAKAKKPTTKKTKTPKAAKPRKVTLLSTELDPLREADSILTDVEKAETECERRALRVELAKEDYTSARVAYKDAVVELRKLCRARKESHPLFQQPAKSETSLTIDAKVVKKSPPVTLPMVTIAGQTEIHGLTVGASLPVYLVKPGGIIVTSPDGNATAITDEEYTADEPTAALIAEARDAGLLSDDGKWARFVAGKQAPPKQDWQALPLDAAKINGRGGKLLTEAGYETLGAVAKLMKDHGQWWNKEVKGIGEETAAEIADRFAEFWAAHPEYCQTGAVA